MIPFHKLYAFLFKSFSISEETKIVERLIEQGYTKMMMIKRSWVYILKIIWIPIVLIILSGGSIWVAINSIDSAHAGLKWIIIIGNSLMTGILTFSSIFYWIHFRNIYHNTDKIIDNLQEFKEKLLQGDKHFITFFNWSLTNQWLLGIIIILEIIFITSSFQTISKNGHLLIILLDFVIICAELFLLQRYRKHMIDLEMDYNIVVQGKMFFINQSGVLSNTQTLESNKIKTIKSTFPHFIASFFNYGSIEILAEGDIGNLGEMNMDYVTSPTKVVNSMQLLLGEERSIPPKIKEEQEKMEEAKEKAETPPIVIIEEKQPESRTHSQKTRGKVRNILN